MVGLHFQSNGEIFTINSDGTNLTNLTNHFAHDSRPSFSPDGNQIAFVSDRANAFDGRGTQIFVMDTNGENQQPIIEMQTQLDAPKWSPNNGLLIFTSQSDKIHIGGNLKPIFIGEGSNPTWGASDQIAFIRYDTKDKTQENIYVQSVHSDTPIRITNFRGDEKHPAWSPDGRLIAYAGNNKEDSFDIFVMNADGTENINLSRNAGDDRAPTWSSDGNQIAFMSNRDESFNWEIFVMNVNGSNQTNITNNGNTNDKYPSWQK